MCAPGVTRNTSIRYSSSYYTRVKYLSAAIVLDTGDVELHHHAPQTKIEHF